MSQLNFTFKQHTLQLSLEHATIHLKLSPIKLSATPTYTYSTKLDSNNMEPRLSLIFNSTANLWKYLNFYKERAVVLDVARIAVENQLLSESKDLEMKDKGNVELPVSIRLILLEDIESLIPLNGDIVVDSLQKNLTRSLKENDQLREKLALSHARISCL